MMGVASWMVWREGKNGTSSERRRRALVLYTIQLVMNLTWPVVFFLGRSLRGSLGVIAALILSLVATFIAFLPVNKTAAMLLLPYLAWVVFAFMLNLTFVTLNL